MEQCEDIRHTDGNKELYERKKETIERLFGTAKEHHGFRYTQMKGKAKMEMKVSLTFACLNLKRLAKILDQRDGNPPAPKDFLLIFTLFFKNLNLTTRKAGCFA